MTLSPVIENLLEQILILEDSEAVPILVYILEHTNLTQTNINFEKLLSAEHYGIKLTADNQREILRRLFKSAPTHKLSASMLWICSKANPLILAEMIPQFLLTLDTILDKNVLYQGIIAFQNGLFVEQNHPDSAKIIFHITAAYDALSTLFENLCHSPHQNISEQAQMSLELLEQWIE
ncbi:MAG: hypothetical protein ACPG7F_10645 [Aggregatilineales bacterium]